MRQEYAHYYGKQLSNPEVERGFELANQRVTAKDYTNAVGLLEQVSKVAAVPMVFNNLGVLYAQLNDKSRAINSFREALARDLDYRAVRVNLDRMKDVMALGADPVSREVEPNNSTTSANIMVPGKPVEGDIEAAVNDVDFFRVTTPPAPRDRITIDITNRSTTLAPVLKIFDDQGRIRDWGKSVREPGANLQQIIAPQPNETLYVAVSGYGSSAGAYTLLVRPLKSFDSYEPNDDIYNAPRIVMGTPIQAGIMDAKDTDYFSFVSPQDRERLDHHHQPVQDADSCVEHVLSRHAVERLRSGHTDARAESAAHNGCAGEPDLFPPGLGAGGHGWRIFANNRVTPIGSPMWYGMAEWNLSQNWTTTQRRRSTGSSLSKLPNKSAQGCWPEESGYQPLANWLACLD